MGSKESKYLQEMIENHQLQFKRLYHDYQDFNDDIDGDGAVEIIGIGDEQNTYLYSASEVLFWVDSKAYMAELDSWRELKMHETHQEIMDYR